MSADALPPEEDQLEAESGAPESGISPNEDAPFNINDIADEQVRAEVERYQKQVQADYTRKTQELASQRAEYEQAQQFIQGLQTDPATRQALFAELAAEHGYTLSDDEEPDDPWERLEARQAAIEQRFAQQEAAEQEQQMIAAVAAQVEADFAEMPGLTEKQQKLIVDSAASRPATPEGFLDVKGVYREFLEAAQDFSKAQRKSKQAPQVSRAGVAGQVKVDLSDPEARQEAMLQHLRAARDD
jgi:hypothetical protein